MEYDSEFEEFVLHDGKNKKISILFVANDENMSTKQKNYTINMTYF